MLYELGMAELLLVVVLILALPVAGLWVVGDDAPVVVDAAECLGNAGADEVQDLLNESQEVYDEKAQQSSKQYYQANKNARVEKTKKTSNVVEQRVDPFKQEA